MGTFWYSLGEYLRFWVPSKMLVRSGIPEVGWLEPCLPGWWSSRCPRHKKKSIMYSRLTKILYSKPGSHINNSNNPCISSWNFIRTVNIVNHSHPQSSLHGILLAWQHLARHSAMSEPELTPLKFVTCPLIVLRDKPFQNWNGPLKKVIFVNSLGGKLHVASVCIPKNWKVGHYLSQSLDSNKYPLEPGDSKPAWRNISWHTQILQLWHLDLG